MPKPSETHWGASQIPDLSGKIAIVTGGSGGIGLRVVDELAKHGAKVYMAARSEQKSNDAIKELESKDESIKGRIHWLKLDLMSVKGCQQAAQDFLSKEKALHYLFNNAGIMAGPYKLTDDGIESQFATNHLGPFAFTMKLLPLMQETAKADPSFKPRIINMSSIAHEGSRTSRPRFQSKDDINASYGPWKIGAWKRYAISKLCAVLFSKELNERYPDIISSSAHPGIVKSGLWQYSLLRYADSAFTPPEQGAIQPLYCAFGPDDVRNAYIVPIATKGQQNAHAKDPQLAKDLWTLSEKLVADITGST